MRRAVIDRRTTETQIALAIALDGKGQYQVRTGIRFLDHMLELFARHGGFNLKIDARGDLDVDQHHTVEDLGIALGEAVSKALLYAACDRLGLAYVKSHANFVLVRAGDRTDALVKGAFAKGIYFRDRSTEPGCAGSLRIATSIVEHTRRAIAVMEEVLCGVR